MFWFMWTIVFAVLLSLVAMAICLIIIIMAQDKINRFEEASDEKFIFERGPCKS